MIDDQMRNFLIILYIKDLIDKDFQSLFSVYKKSFINRNLASE